jgi:predicted transposase YdaD
VKNKQKKAKQNLNLNQNQNQNFMQEASEELMQEKGLQKTKKNQKSK